MVKKIEEAGYVSNEPVVVVETPQVTPKNAIDISELTADELLEAAADKLEKRQRPRANKHYRLLAAEIRALLARING
jgi:hypothetical protein